MTPGLTAEQVLLLADEFCAAHRVQIRDFGALVAAATVPGAQISGIPVHAGTQAAGRAFAEAVIALEPLSDRNRDFAAVCRKVYLLMYS
ncbi:TetR family transcriptional regulator [Corynebacterium nasicanis]|uniref:TetR family transcriptional regulator n=1 Tax=Corynebacterium nasicanis TaxID=1448267 RepID=A0ABW1QCP4_9CORY